MIVAEFIIIILCLLLLLFLSSVESAISQLGLVTLKMLSEKREGDKLLQLIYDDRLQVLIPLHVGTQTCTLTMAVFITRLALERFPDYGVLVALVGMVIVVLLFRQIIPRLLTARDPERALLALLPPFRGLYRILRALSFPISSTLALVRKNHQRAEERTTPAAEEATPEEIQAYIDVGEAEGILEKDDSRLIQSVVEFGDTLVKEVMTPRTEIVAISEKATLRELRDLIVREKHSRIPVYREQIDNIIGIAYVRNLLSQWEAGSGDEPLTATILPVHFVPETKRVRELLRELQASGDHMAIIIDEFGGVAGLVTIEDLLEEIVGEIRDEDEAQTSEVAEEGSHSYVLRGSAELRKLEELFDLDLSPVPYSTVSGLIVSILGRVPSAGETVDYAGLKVEILEADRKKIHRLRVKRAEAPVRDLTARAQQTPP